MRDLLCFIYLKNIGRILKSPVYSLACFKTPPLLYKLFDDNNNYQETDSSSTNKGKLIHDKLWLLSGDSVTCYRCRYRTPTLFRRDETQGTCRYLVTVQRLISPSCLR